MGYIPINTCDGTQETPNIAYPALDGRRAGGRGDHIEGHHGHHDQLQGHHDHLEGHHDQLECHHDHLESHHDDHLEGHHDHLEGLLHDLDDPQGLLQHEVPQGPQGLAGGLGGWRHVDDVGCTDG